MKQAEKRQLEVWNYRLKKMLSKSTICYYCSSKAETLHHKNENHNDNRVSNLIPLCHKCHLIIPHKCDTTPQTTVAEKVVPQVCKELSLGLSGINKVCSQCMRQCRQWSQVIILCCPNFKRVGQQAQQNAPEAHSEAIIQG